MGKLLTVVQAECEDQGNGGRRPGRECMIIIIKSAPFVSGSGMSNLSCGCLHAVRRTSRYCWGKKCRSNWERLGALTGMYVKSGGRSHCFRLRSVALMFSQAVHRQACWSWLRGAVLLACGTCWWFKTAREAASGVIVVSIVFGGGEVCIAYTSVFVNLLDLKHVLIYV